MLRVAAIGSFAICLAASSGTAQAASGCRLGDRFTDPALVLHDAKRSLFWTRPLAVNLDGAANAYHRDDPHGNKGLAIEYMGHGMRIFQGNKKLPFIYQEEDNGEWLAAYRRIVANDWKKSGGFRPEIFGFERDESGKVCHGSANEDGKLVSATSLTLKSGEDCDQDQYVDALKFPGIVVPKREQNETAVSGNKAIAPPFAKRGVRLGDLAMVHDPKSNSWKGAFVFDTGPRRKLGEGSVRLIMDLTGSAAPTSAKAANAMGMAETHVVLFPGSVADLGPKKDWTAERIEAAAAKRFQAWGGGSLDAAKARLLACAKEYAHGR